MVRVRALGVPAVELVVLPRLHRLRGGGGVVGEDVGQGAHEGDVRILVAQRLDLREQYAVGGRRRLRGHDVDVTASEILIRAQRLRE